MLYDTLTLAVKSSLLAKMIVGISFLLVVMVLLKHYILHLLLQFHDKYFFLRSILDSLIPIIESNLIKAILALIISLSIELLNVHPYSDLHVLVSCCMRLAKSNGQINIAACTAVRSTSTLCTPVLHSITRCSVVWPYHR